MVVLMIKEATIILGTFDGMHLGHKQLIKKAVSLAVNSHIYVCAFTPHPMEILSPNSAPKLLTTSFEKKRIIEDIEHLKYYEIVFDKKIAAMDDKTFIDYLRSCFDIKNIIVGYNFRFGLNAKYDTNDMDSVCTLNNINCYIVDEYKIDSIKISSTEIRNALDDGDIILCNSMLGREYLIEHKVISGRRIGHEIGFPTANAYIDEKKQYPKTGVYFTKTLIDAVWYPSMTNIGHNPTVGNCQKLRMETHIIGLDKTLYNKTIKVKFYMRLRDEKKFLDTSQLIKQLNADKENVLNIHEYNMKKKDK